MLLELTRTAKRILYLTPIDTVKISDIDLDAEYEGVFKGSFSFSHSFDDVNWSNFLSIEDFKTNINITIDNSKSKILYVRVLAICEEKDNTTFSPKNFNYFGLKHIRINGEYLDVIEVEYYTDRKIIKNTNSSNTFNPYRGVDCANDMRQEISDSILNTIGLECVYFKNIPDEDTKSRVFKSYKLYNSLEPQEIKVVLKSDDEHNTDVMSYQHYSSVENIEMDITKTEWKRVFGELLPNAKDSIFIKVLNRMYRVAQVKDDRNFMNKSVAWTFYLGKYLEGVELDTENSKKEIDDFTNFTAYDDEQSEETQREFEDYTRIDDDIETSHKDKYTTNFNERSKLISFGKGIENIDASIEYNTVEFLKYLYKPKDDIDYITKYDISEVDENNEYTFSSWFIMDDLNKSIKIMDISDDKNTAEILYVNSSGYMSLMVETNRKVYNTANGTPMVKDGVYGVVFSRYRKSIIVNIFELKDGKINTIQSIMKSVSESSIHKNVMKIKGDSRLSIGRIRLYDGVVPKKMIIPFITNTIIDAKKYIIIDDCIPTTKGMYSSMK